MPAARLPLKIERVRDEKRALPGIEWVIGEIIGREKLVDSGLSAL